MSLNRCPECGFPVRHPSNVGRHMCVCPKELPLTPKYTQLLKKYQDLQAENERLKADSLVPGVMHCARCKFQVVRTNLNMSSGTVSAGDSQTEPCPNGCGPLWPVTWKQWAQELGKTADQLADELTKAKEASANRHFRAEAIRFASDHCMCNTDRERLRGIAERIDKGEL